MSATDGMSFIVEGGRPLSGTVATNSSKNGAVALIAASLLNKGTTVLKKVPKIEEVHRLVEVLRSMGVAAEWDDHTLTITPPDRLRLEDIDHAAAARTRAIAMFVAPLAHLFDSFDLPAPSGCDLGKRTLGPQVDALARLGITFTGDEECHTYHVEAREKKPAEIVMYEASNTGTEAVLMAAAKIPGVTTIKYAAADYMVQDLCYFLERCGVKIDGIGTSTLVVHGVEDIDAEIVGGPTEDPIESMFFFAAAASTRSELTIERCPIDVLELELLTLETMGLAYERGTSYLADNERTHLCDIKVKPSDLIAPPEKIAARPFPGINADNLPFFVPIATQAKGRTQILDWMYDGRAKWYMELSKLGADMEQPDPHRVFINGPTKLHAADIVAPPALRPATILLIGMLAAEGRSVLKNVYSINRGYEDLVERLSALRASIGSKN